MGTSSRDKPNRLGVREGLNQYTLITEGRKKLAK